MDSFLELAEIAAERKPGFFVKVKGGSNFNRMNTWCIPAVKI